MFARHRNLIAACLLFVVAVGSACARPIEETDTGSWWVGRGPVVVKGTGSWLFKGKGVLKITGAGLVSLNKNARFAIQGKGWVVVNRLRRISFAGQGEVRVDLRGTTVTVAATSQTKVSAAGRGRFFLGAGSQGDMEFSPRYWKREN